MSNKGKLRKLFVSLGIKGILCIICLLICLSSVSFALITYTNTVTITPTDQLTVGTATTTWTIYPNQQGTQYMPGGSSESTLNTGDTTTYAFKVVTDAHEVCAVKVELTSAMNPDQFSSFDITVLSSTGGTWSAEPLYAASTGTTTKASINGLIQGDAAYIHQDVSLTQYYEIQVTYSYIGVNTPITATFQFTPLPLNGF
ncbi:MAG: hypothetical protein ABSA75_11875 [Candidatus Bathyarchaeia archaeon]|jgi:hypothetical protein